jgi:CPA2 family monovalent cation:H+ antiporter-2
VENIPSIVQDLALILVTAGVVTLIFKKLKQPLVLGYIMAGFIVSPNFPLTVSVVDHKNIEIWGNIGVMFLLFTLGLDFSFKKILKMGMAPIIAALTIVFSMMMIGIFVSRLFGWSQINGMFLAGMLAMSSTTIIYKAFDDMGLKQQQCPLVNHLRPDWNDFDPAHPDDPQQFVWYLSGNSNILKPDGN